MDQQVNLLNVGNLIMTSISVENSFPVVCLNMKFEYNNRYLCSQPSKCMYIIVQTLL